MPFNLAQFIRVFRAGGIAPTSPPTVITAPSIASTVPGVIQVGVPLVITPGVYAGNLVGPTRQLLLNGSAVGSVGLSYTPVTGDVGGQLSVREDVFNAAGHTQSTSAAVGPVLPASSFDFTISTVSDLTSLVSQHIAGSINLAGKTVGVNPGTYSLPSITGLNPTSPVTFKATSGLPRWDQLAIIDSRNLKFDGLQLVSSAWPGARTSVTNGAKPAVRFAGVVGDGVSQGVSFVNCPWRGNYQGNVDAVYDPTKGDYPELACVDCTVSGGVLQSVTIPSGLDNVAGLSPNVPDQLNVPLNFFLGSGANGLVDIVGGKLTNARLTAPGFGGSGFVNAATTSFVQFQGQTPFEEWMPFAVQIATHTGDPAAVFQGPMTIQNCSFTGFSNVIKACPQPGDVLIEGNTLDANFDDQISLGLVGSTPPGKCTIRWNVIKRTFSKVGDADDPHPDPIQLYMNDKTSPYTSADWELDITGNVIFTGVSRGEVQGMFISNSAPGKNYKGRITGNVVLGAGANNTCYLTGNRDLFIHGNIFARYSPTNPPNPSGANISLSLNNSAGHTFFGNNICENFQSGYFDTSVDWLSFSNVFMGTNGGDIGGYVNVMPSFALGASTVADVVANFAPAAAYALKGALRAGYVDYVNRVIDRTLEPTVVRFATVLDVALGSTQTSLGSKIIGGPDTVAWSVAGGQVRFADDEAMTVNVSAWQTGSGSETLGRFAQVKQTASGLVSTSVTTTLTLNGTANTFITRTVASVTYPQVSNGGAAYSTVASPSSDTGVKRMLIALRFKDTARVAGAQILANSTANGLTLWWPNTTNIRFELKNSGVIHFRPAPFLPDGAAHTHLIAIDFTKSVREQVAKWVVDKTPQGIGPNSSVDTTTSQSLSMATILSTSLGLFNNGAGSASAWTGAGELAWIGWGDGTWAMPDIFDSTVQDAFAADNIAGDGTVAGVRPQLCYKGNAAAWNAGIANIGSLASKPLVKQAGTYS